MNGKSTDGQRIVTVVGATGRLGRLLVQQFAETGWHVRALVRRSSMAAGLFARLRNVQVVIGDLVTTDDIVSACENCSLVIFAAGARRPAYATDLQAERDFQQINVEALRYVGQAVLKAGNPPLIHLGSLFALGMAQQGTLTETTLATPSSPFEKSEWQGEQELLRLHESDGLDCRIMRLPPVAGAAPRGGLLDALRTAAADPDWNPLLEENAHATKPLLRPSDFFSAVRHTYELGISGKLYHFSSGNFSLRCMVDELRSLMQGGYTVHDLMLGHPERSDALTQFLARYVKWDVRIPTAYSSSSLGWKPRYPADSGTIFDEQWQRLHNGHSDDLTTPDG